MRVLLLSVCIVFILACAASCWRSADSEGANNSTEVQLPPAEYSDANVALADGTKLLDEGEIDRAIDVLNQAVKLDTDLAEAWFKLGIAYALAEKRDQTLVEETGTPERSSDKPHVRKTNSEKAFEKAVTAYKKIIAANDQNDVAFFNLGRAYNKLNEDEDAAKALKQAVKLKTDDTEYQTELGAILIKLAQYHEAIAPLKKALELDPENLRAQELLEDAEAGRSRVNYASTPKPDKTVTPGDNSNTNASLPVNGQEKPPPPPANGQSRPRPTPSRPE